MGEQFTSTFRLRRAPVLRCVKRPNTIMQRTIRPGLGIAIAAMFVCCFLTIMVLELDSDETPVLRERVTNVRHGGATSARVWLNLAKKAQRDNRHIKHQDASQSKDGAKAQAHTTVKAKKLALARQHKNMHLRRKAIRHGAAGAVKEMMEKAMATMVTKVKAHAAKEAKKAAKKTVAEKGGGKGKSPTGGTIHNQGANYKLKMLQKDVLLLEAAEKKALQEKAQQKLDIAKKTAHYKALATAKLIKLKKDFDLLKKKLKQYEGAKKAALEAHFSLKEYSAKIVHANTLLQHAQKRLTRFKKREAAWLERHQKRRAKEEAKFQAKVKHFQEVIAKLRAELKKVQAGSGVSPAMLGRIKGEQAVIAGEEKKLAAEEAYIKRLKTQLKKALARTKAFKIKAKHRKKVLRIAHIAYTNLRRAMARLQAMIDQHAKTVKLHGPHTNSKKATKKMVKGVVHTIHALYKKAALAIQQAAADKAKDAAQAEATKRSKFNLNQHLGGINAALANAKGMIADVSKKTTEAMIEVPAKKKSRDMEGVVTLH